MNNSVNRYFEGFLVGGTVGFVVGLLTAPKPGADLRRELSVKSEDLLRHCKILNHARAR
jgi:gas vesicle protein